MTAIIFLRPRPIAEALEEADTAIHNSPPKYGVFIKKSCLGICRCHR